MMKTHYKDTFEKISDDKRQKILDTAIEEFASKGFRTANVNIIAKNADISIGSMYNYFASKDDLFLTILDYGYDLLHEAIGNVNLQDGDIYAKIENLLKAAQSYALKYPELNQIYLDLSTEGLSHISERLSKKIETISSNYYKELIRQGKKDGTVNKDLDENVAIFCMDNLIMMIQYSFTSNYFKERMKIFIGEDTFNDPERIIKGVLAFIRKALQP